MNDFVMPNSLTAERALLSAMLMDPACIDQVLQRVSKDEFYRPDHGALFELMAERHRSGDPVDRVIIQAEVMAHEKGEQNFGGIDYVLNLDDCPSTTNATYYADIVADKAQARMVVKSCLEGAARVAGGDMEATATIAATLMMATEKRANQPVVMTKREVLLDGAHVVQTGLKGGVKTGLSVVDRLLRFCMARDWTLIGGTPGGGKSVAMSTIAHHLEELGHCIAEVHLEMDSMGLGLREVAARANVDMSSIMDALDGGDLGDHGLSPEQWDKIHEAIAGSSERAYFVSLAMANMAQVQAMVAQMDRRARREHGAGISAFFVDFAQIITHDEDSASAGNIFIGYAMKVIAKRFDCHGFLSTQLNRKGGVAARAGEPLTQEHIYGGGGLAMAAQNVILIDRDQLLTPDIAAWWIPKARYGQTGKAVVTFDGAHQRFREPEDIGAVDLQNPDNPAGLAIAASLGLNDIPEPHPSWTGARE